MKSFFYISFFTLIIKIISTTSWSSDYLRSILFWSMSYCQGWRRHKFWGGAKVTWLVTWPKISHVTITTFSAFSLCNFFILVIQRNWVILYTTSLLGTSEDCMSGITQAKQANHCTRRTRNWLVIKWINYR